MAYEGKLRVVSVNQTNSVHVATSTGEFGEVLQEAQQDFPDVGSFVEALDSKQEQLTALLPWIPLLQARRSNPGNIAALYAVANKRVVLNLDPGQTVLTFPAA